MKIFYLILCFSIVKNEISNLNNIDKNQQNNINIEERNLSLQQKGEMYSLLTRQLSNTTMQVAIFLPLLFIFLNSSLPIWSFPFITVPIILLFTHSLFGTNGQHHQTFEQNSLRQRKLVKNQIRKLTEKHISNLQLDVEKFLNQKKYLRKVVANERELIDIGLDYFEHKKQYFNYLENDIQIIAQKLFQRKDYLLSLIPS